jgi:DeoR/GlpR family transcriptional regulator of sugar metabolism
MTATPRKSALIPAQRRSSILEMIRQRGVVSVQGLSDAIGSLAFCDAFAIGDVSEVITDHRLDPRIRRRLEKQGVKVSIATLTSPSRAQETSHRERRKIR